MKAFVSCGDGHVGRGGGIWKQVDGRHILPYILYPKSKHMVPDSRYVNERKNKIMAAPENSKMIAPGVYKEVLKH